MKRIIIIALLSILFKSAFSQQIPQDQADVLTSLANNKGKSFTQTNFTPFGTSAFSNLISNISASSTFNKGQNAKGEFKYTTQNWWTAGITVDQKLGKNSKEATPFDLFEGISPGTTLKFNLQKMFWNPLLTASEFNNFDNAANNYAHRTREDRRTVTYNRILTNGNEAEINAINNVKLKQPVFFNVEAALVKADYTYSNDSFSLAKLNENFITPSVAVFIGIPFSVQSFLAVGYNYSENYQASDELSFISRFGRSDNLFTQTLAFGAPQKKTDNRIYAEWRMGFGSEGKPSSFSIGPSLTWGLTSKKVAAYLPIYFINGKTSEGKLNGLQGGIRLRYITSTEKGMGSSFKEGFGAQLMITAPFGIFGNLNQ